MWAGVALLALIVLAVVAWRARSVEATATTVVRSDIVRTLVLTGRVRPPARPQLGASISGAVREVLAREGDHVRRGQLLIRIDDAQALATVAQARAVLAQVEARTRSTADQAELAYQQATSDLARARTLHAQGAISARELEVAERTAADARSQLDAARARSATGGSTQLAEVAGARAALAVAQSQLALTRITAPAAATVVARRVEPGDVVVPGQVLMELALDGRTELVAFAREENLADLKRGRTALASADAFPSSSFAAQVDWIAPAVDPAQGTVEVRFVVPEPPAYLLADMTVSINVDVGRRDSALMIPRELVREATSAKPWVAVAVDGRAERREVRIGLLGDGEVEVVDGLVEGDRVLRADIPPGKRVRLRP